MSGSVEGNTVLAVSGLSYEYPQGFALKDVNLTISEGEVLVLLGPNGAGKTTLFSLITRLYDARQGNVTVLGQELVVRCRKGEKPRKDARICCRASQIQSVGTSQPGFEGTITRAVYRGGSARIEFEPEAAPHLGLHFDQPDPVSFAAGERARLAITSGWLIPADGAA